MWQPIETAPKDQFLLLCGPSGYTTIPMVVTTGRMCSDYHAGRWIDHANDDLTDWGFVPTHWMPMLTAPNAQPAPSSMDAIIDDLQSQFDSEGITEHDSGDALIRLSDAIAAVRDNFAGAQPTQSVPDTYAAGINAVAAMLQSKADEYAKEHGHDDMGGLSFGPGMGGEIKMDYYTNLVELVDDVRAMLADAPSVPNDVVEQAVNRFLSWKLPKDFHPDGGMVFIPTKGRGYDSPHWPAGTNLLNAQQAREMLRYVLAAAPETKP